MKPTIGRTVHYTLSAADAEQINRRRTTPGSISERIGAAVWPVGAQAHIGNEAKHGDVLPMLIVRVNGGETSSVNGQVFLDGCDVFWATERVLATGYKQGSWSWPPREG